MVSIAFNAGAKSSSLPLQVQYQVLVCRGMWYKKQTIFSTILVEVNRNFHTVAHSVHTQTSAKFRCWSSQFSRVPPIFLKLEIVARSPISASAICDCPLWTMTAQRGMPKVWYIPSCQSSSTRIALHWVNTRVVQGATSNEGDLRSVLIPGGEYCREIDLPKWRRTEIEREAAKRGMTFTQAMSLRRQFMRRDSSHFPRLSSESDQQQCSREFEAGVSAFLTKLTIHSIPERSQPRVRGVPTPDFILKEPVLINDKTVHWIEVKSFYGCGSLTSKKLAIGKLPQQTS
eukprot:884216-Rhodomonas_salina.1